MEPLKGFLGRLIGDKPDKQEKEKKKLRPEDEKAATGAEKLKEEQPRASKGKIEKEVKHVPPQTPPAVPFAPAKITEKGFLSSLTNLEGTHDTLTSLAAPKKGKQQTFEDYIPEHSNQFGIFEAYQKEFVNLEKQLKEAAQKKKWAQDPDLQTRLQNIRGPAIAVDRVKANVETTKAFKKFGEAKKEELQKQQKKKSVDEAVQAGDAAKEAESLQPTWQRNPPPARKPPLPPSKRVESGEKRSPSLTPKDDDSLQDTAAFHSLDDEEASTTSKRSSKKEPPPVPAFPKDIEKFPISPVSPTIDDAVKARDSFVKKLSESVATYNTAYLKHINITLNKPMSESDRQSLKTNSQKFLKLFEELERLATQFDTSTLTAEQQKQFNFCKRGVERLKPYAQENQ